jgi:hypothetical protein
MFIWNRSPAVASPATPTTVALAITLEAGILTNDHDFFGCGYPTWTVETLRAELANT